MNQVTEINRKQIFEATINSAEIEAINELVDKHKANSAVTQQLALDASKLVTTSQERLVKQSEAGFFKRIACAISGKTSENQLLNQMDMLQMQKFAWHYLQQLQQQNLINAQSIAVIRNNLGVMNEYIIETRDFLELAIDRIDSRLKHVEANTNFNTWALNIDANKRRFKSIPKAMLILRLAYDFMRSHDDIRLTERDIGNYLITTLEKLDVNCDDEIQLLEFIGELIDQIEIVGIGQYRDVIKLSVGDEYIIDSDYIQRSISGVGFNALYLLSDYYEKIVDIINDDELCNSDEAREKIIAKMFGGEFADLSISYSIRDLIFEIIGGGQLAIDVYKEENGLNVSQDELMDESVPEIHSIISKLPSVRNHTFLQKSENNESKFNYLLLLALCVEDSSFLTNIASEFLVILSEVAGLPSDKLKKDIVELADNQRKYVECQAPMRELLDSDEKKYTWLLDAFFILLLANKPIENQQIKTIIGIIKPGDLKNCFQNMLVLITESDTSQVLNAAIKLAPYTQGWKNIIRYRELRFDQYFAEVDNLLYMADSAVTRLNLEMIDVYGKGMEHAVFFSFSDGGFLSNLGAKAAAAVCVQGRKSAIDRLNNFRRKMDDCISENRFALSRANGFISQWGHQAFEFDDVGFYSEFDLDNSVDNEDWSNQFDCYYRQVENKIDKFSKACDNATQQIGFFKKGDFDASVVKIREQRHEEYLRQQQQEKLEKQSVTIKKDGVECLFRIEWERVANPPCDIGDINCIKTDGNLWIIVANVNSQEVFYRSEDGVDWRQVWLDDEDIKIYFKKIDVVNGVWVVWNDELYEGTREKGFYYSIDAISWRHSGFSLLNESEYEWLSTKNIIYFDGNWLWCCTCRDEYNYIEKGFFSDSTRTGSYQKIVIFFSQSLSGPWELWDKTPKTSEGVEVEIIRSLPGDSALLMFCKHNSSYISDKKKPEVKPFLMYYGAAKSWGKCYWNGDVDFTDYRPPVFLENGKKLICFNGGEIFVSEKGYEWSKKELNVYVEECFAINEYFIFTKSHGSEILLSQDINIFSEVILDEGNWSCLTANSHGILGLYDMNRHEEKVMRFGRYVFQSMK